jgi:hypothetical protein
MTDLLTATLPEALRAPVADEADAPGSALAGSVAHDLALAVAPPPGGGRAGAPPAAGRSQAGAWNEGK